jgi:hypothetical protein
MSPCQLGDGRQLISRAQAAGHDLLAQSAAITSYSPRGARGAAIHGARDCTS